MLNILAFLVPNVPLDKWSKCGYHAHTCIFMWACHDVCLQVRELLAGLSSLLSPLNSGIELRPFYPPSPEMCCLFCFCKRACSKGEPAMLAWACLLSSLYPVTVLPPFVSVHTFISDTRSRVLQMLPHSESAWLLLYWGLQCFPFLFIPCGRRQVWRRKGSKSVLHLFPVSKFAFEAWQRPGKRSAMSVHGK